jgi:hypothetical protein
MAHAGKVIYLKPEYKPEEPMQPPRLEQEPVREMEAQTRVLLEKKAPPVIGVLLLYVIVLFVVVAVLCVVRAFS